MGKKEMQIVLLDQMVNAYRNSHRANFKPRAFLTAENFSDDLFSLIQKLPFLSET